MSWAESQLLWAESELSFDAAAAAVLASERTVIIMFKHSMQTLH